MRRIEIHLKDFVLHSESEKVIQRKFESQKRKEKKWEELILYYIQNPKREFKEDLKPKKEKKRNEKNWNPTEGFCSGGLLPLAFTTKINGSQLKKGGLKIRLRFLLLISNAVE